jgi:hypothetical protein
MERVFAEQGVFRLELMLLRAWQIQRSRISVLEGRPGTQNHLNRESLLLYYNIDHSCSHRGGISLANRHMVTIILR